MTLLELDPDELLSTTRAVRKRLDLTREVPADLIRECVAAALQAPSGGNVVTMQFVVVTDRALKAGIAEHYKRSYDAYRAGRPATDAQQQRVANSSDYLSTHMAEVPALVIGCNRGADRKAATAGMGNILPGMWSFMLAARARGLGTAWTTLHLPYEREVAELLGLDYETTKQAVLTPVAYTLGTDFKPALRPAPDEFILWR